jgi:hypothetical protein
VINMNGVPELALSPSTARNREFTNPDNDAAILGDPDVSILRLVAPLTHRLSDEGLGLGDRVGAHAWYRQASRVEAHTCTAAQSSISMGRSVMSGAVRFDSSGS